MNNQLNIFERIVEDLMSVVPFQISNLEKEIQAYATLKRIGRCMLNCDIGQIPMKGYYI